MNTKKRLLTAAALLAALALSPAASAYDPTQGALQNNPALSPYGYNTNGVGYGGGTYSAPLTGVAISATLDGRHYEHVWNAASASEASSLATRNCERKTGQTCVPVTSFSNGCVVVATGIRPNGESAFWGGFGRNRQQTKDDALESCRKDGARNCQISSRMTCSN